MSDTVTDMYGDNDDVDDPTTESQTSQVSLQERGAIKEVEIDGKKISVVDAALVLRLENTVRNMQNTIAKLENNLRNLNIRMAATERRIQVVNTELDNKVSYE
jgi:hypothetical protein